MKKELTKVICERCGREKVLEARKLGIFRKSAPYPRDWTRIWKKLRVCPSCELSFEEAWNKYLAGGIVSQDTKVLEAKH